MAERAPKQQEQPKVLRIGVFAGGKVVKERLVRPGSDVTIGTSPRNTFVVESEGFPARLVLFTSKGPRFSLSFTEEMDGKLQLDSGVANLAELRQRADTPKKGNAWQVALTETSRGKVAIGELTILFQFVPAPPESARVVAAGDFRPRLLDDDDPVFLGFLALWSALAAVLMVYVFNTEPVDLVKPEDIPDRFADILVESKDPQEPTEEPEMIESDEGSIARKEEKPDEGSREAKPKNEAEAKAAAAAAAARKREDTIQRSKLLTALIGTRGEANNGSTVQDLLGDQDNKFGDLASALQNVDGTAVASDASIAANKGATDGRGTGDASIGDLARAGTGEGSGVGSGPGTTVTGRADVGNIDAGGAEGADSATKTIKKYRGQVQSCYERILKSNPSVKGRIAIVIDVSAGRVTNVSIEDNGTNNAELETCVKSAVRRWRFEEEVSGTLESTFVLAPSG